MDAQGHLLVSGGCDTDIMLIVKYGTIARQKRLLDIGVDIKCREQGKDFPRGSGFSLLPKRSTLNRGAGVAQLVEQLTCNQ